MCDKYGPTDQDAIKDFVRYPELRFLDRHDWIGPWALGIASYLIAGWSGLIVGFFGSTVLLWHTTFSVNSVAHIFGRRRYQTTDTSRNSLLLALVTGGEGWHNNHHAFPGSARIGLEPGQVDPGWWLLCIFGRLGLAWNFVLPEHLPYRPALRRVADSGEGCPVVTRWLARS